MTIRKMVDYMDCKQSNFRSRMRDHGGKVFREIVDVSRATCSRVPLLRGYAIRQLGARKNLTGVRIPVFAIVGILVVSGIGCRKSQEQNTSEPEGERIVVIFNWEDYLDADLLVEFTRQTGIKVVVDNFDTTDEFVAKVKSDPSRCDLMVTDDSTIAVLRELRLLRAIDHKKLTALNNLDPAYLNLDFDPGNQYSIPYLWGTTVLAYRKDKISSPPTSWRSLWNADYAGHIMMIDDTQDMFAIALAILGHSINTAVGSELDAAREKLLEQAELVTSYSNIYDINEAIVSGQCWIAPMYSGDIIADAQEHPEIGYVIPDEGTVLWIDSFAIPRDSRNHDEAHAFINFLLAPKNAAANANELCYATPNAAAMPYIEKKFLDDPQIYPPQEVLAKCEFLSKLDQSRLRKLNTSWIDIQEKIRLNKADRSLQPAISE